MRIAGQILPGIRRFAPGLMIAFGLLLSEQAAAQDMTNVDAGARVEINAHGICRRVLNGTGTPAMIPLRSPDEWSVGGSAFLQNVPEGMIAYACVSPEIALRRWSRPGPPGSLGQPFVVNGADHGLTFTSVGTSSDGVDPVLTGNQIRYTPVPSQWRIPNLDSMTDTVPFEAIDSEGISVSGTLRVTLVGYETGRAYIYFRYNAPNETQSEYGDWSPSTSSTKSSVRIHLMFHASTEIFDGGVNFSGLMSLKFRVGNVVVIDNSPASMAPYSGPAVGDVNGDGTANTILDAQIKAALDFVDTSIANRQAEVGSVRLEGLNDPLTFMGINNFGEENPNPEDPSSGSGLSPIWIYTANATGTFVGQTDLTSYNEYRSSARTALLGIRSSGSALNTAQVFGILDTQVTSLVSNQFAMAIHFLSPGSNTGAVPNLARFNQTGTGQLGTPVFSYYTGGNAGSAQATFMASLDHAGTQRHLTSPSVFGSTSPPNPVTPGFLFSQEIAGSFQYVRNPNGTIFNAPMAPTALRNMYAFGVRLLPTTDTTCFNLSCQMAGVPTSIIPNYPHIQSVQGAVNRFRMHPIVFMNPIYRAHYDWNPALFNEGGGIMFNNNFSITGAYTPLPPN
jgi:hypothetical protein